jgi:hypothetical protein
MAKTGAHSDVHRNEGRLATYVRRAWGVQMSKLFLDEARELLWLASLVGGLSVLGVGLAMTLAVWMPAVAPL